MEIFLKAHYFLWWGSLAGILPYTALFAKKYSNASSTEVGLLYTMLPFTALIVKPLFCSLADRFRAHKLILLITIILTLFGYGALILTPFSQLSGFISWWYFCAAVL